jgi:hypothetical protein
LTDKNLFCDTHASVGIASSAEQLQSPEGTSSHTLFSVTPPEKIKEKVVTTPGPWSQQLLDLAAQNKTSDQALCPSNRRSAHKKDQLKGYKSSTCANKNCLGCDVVAPTISPSIIKNLGASFCKVDADKLTTEALGKKTKWLPLEGRNSPRRLLHKILPMMMFPSPSRRSPRSEQWTLSWQDSFSGTFFCTCPFFWSVIITITYNLNCSWTFWLLSVLLVFPYMLSMSWSFGYFSRFYNESSSVI